MGYGGMGYRSMGYGGLGAGGMGYGGMGGLGYGSGMDLGYGGSMGMGGIGSGLHSMGRSSFGNNNFGSSMTRGRHHRNEGQFGSQAMGSNGITDLSNGVGMNGMSPATSPNQPLGTELQSFGGTNNNTMTPGIRDISSPPPPLHETKEERAKRILGERRRERAKLREQKHQREQMRRQAKMEMAGHFTNVLLQSLRSVVEFFTICFGTYYSMINFRQMSNFSQMGYQRSLNGMAPVQKSIQATPSVADGSSLVSKSGGKGWKVWTLFTILFITAEALYNMYQRSKQRNEPSAVELDSEEEEELEEAALAAELGLSQNATSLGEGVSKGVYVATHDYSPTDGEGFLSFKSGDRFFVDNFAEGSWCVARRLEGGDSSSTAGNNVGDSLDAVGYVPSNYLRCLQQLTKL